MPSDSDNDGEGNGNVSSTASSGCSPREAAPGSPPPFLIKTYEMIDDGSSDSIVSWSNQGTSFVVWNPPEFARDLLPRYFKHSNFSSFVRQLNTYGFRKVDPDRWEFANDEFVRGNKSLLRNISRKKPLSQQQQQLQRHVSSGESKPGLEADVDRLKRDKEVLMMELVRLRQQQQRTEKELLIMGQRVQGSEQRQKHMIAFLAKAVQSPAFLAQVLQNEGAKIAARHTKRKQLELLDEHTAMDLVKFDPVQKLSQFFSDPELASQVSSLELLLRELVRQSRSEQDGTGKREGDCQDSNISPPSGVTDLSSQSAATAAEKRSRPPLNLNSEPEENDMVGKATDFQGEVRASVDNGAVGVGFNDVFWERFLTDSETGE